VTIRGFGSKPEIRIRGTSSLREGDAANEPLYVLDGQVISSDAFLTLNPNDIKELKILKDAAASALYGIRLLMVCWKSLRKEVLQVRWCIAIVSVVV